MRPKKCILLIDSDEYRMSLRRFLFETNGFRVLSAESADAAERQFHDDGPDLIVCVCPTPGIDTVALLDRLKMQHSWVPSLALTKNETTRPAGLFADATVYTVSCSNAELLERVRMMAARKRGPRKQPSVERMMTLAERRIA